MIKSTKRFSDRVENYVKYRPDYPPFLINVLENELNFRKDFILADIGSGSGILSKLFLDHGNQVFCVEPNDEMRKAAEIILSEYGNYKSINGTAEKTNLEADSIDLIVAGQSYHWFNNSKTKKEFKRILKPNSSVVLIWNSRKKDNNQFSKEYEELINKFSKDYKHVAHYNISDRDLKLFFNEKGCKTIILENHQILDYNGLKGRLFSSSYMPNQNEKIANTIMKELEGIFNRHQKDEKVSIDYDTEIFVGKIH